MFVCETGVGRCVIAPGEAGEVWVGACQARWWVLPAEMPREQLLQLLHRCTDVRAGDHSWGEGDVVHLGVPALCIVQRCLSPVLLLVGVEWLLVTSTTSEFVLAPEKSRAAAWSIWCAYSWASRQKLAAGLQGHPPWLQTSCIRLANSSGFTSVKFHISVLYVPLNWGWKPQTRVTFCGGNCTALNLNSIVWMLSRANWCAWLAGAQQPELCHCSSHSQHHQQSAEKIPGRGEGIPSALFSATLLGVS